MKLLINLVSLITLVTAIFCIYTGYLYLQLGDMALLSLGLLGAILIQINCVLITVISIYDRLIQ